MTTLELHREYPEAGEEAMFKDMADIVVSRMAAIAKKRGDVIRRGVHAKVTGLVDAEFVVRSDVPAELQQGLFATPGAAFKATVRFSNTQETVEADGARTVHGMAIKLATPRGEQDFVLIDTPTFPFPDAKIYHAFFIRRGDDNDKEAALWLATHHPLILAEVVRVRLTGKVENDLHETYWSAAPFRLGLAGSHAARAVKYIVTPREHPQPGVLEKIKGLFKHEDPNYLTQRTAATLKDHAAVFDFHLQVQTDAEAMPVEDFARQWSEKDSPPVPVATLTIPEQSMTDDQAVLARDPRENLLFWPWHAWPEHEPMGSLNRMRRVVYPRSKETRKVVWGGVEV